MIKQDSRNKKTTKARKAIARKVYVMPNTADTRQDKVTKTTEPTYESWSLPPTSNRPEELRFGQRLKH